MTLPTHAVPQFRPLKGDFSKVPWPKRWQMVREYLNVERSERYRPGFRVEDGGVFVRRPEPPAPVPVRHRAGSA